MSSLSQGFGKNYSGHCRKLRTAVFLTQTDALRHVLLIHLLMIPFDVASKLR